jgi:hypothetical protein
MGGFGCAPRQRANASSLATKACKAFVAATWILAASASRQRQYY